MTRWKTAMAVTAFAALLSTSALAQDTTAPVAEPAATETPAPAPEAAPSDAATTTEAPAATDASAPADPAAAPAPEAAAAPVEAPARIIFFRPGRLTGGAWTYTIAEVDEDGGVDDAADDPRVGRLPNGGYFVHEAQAGIHNYNITGPMAVNLAEDRIRLEVEPGETYYIEQTVRIGLLTGGFRLVPSSQAEFERRRLREWVPDAD
jgi:hypothetical protein